MQPAKINFQKCIRGPDLACNSCETEMAGAFHMLAELIALDGPRFAVAKTWAKQPSRGDAGLTDSPDQLDTLQHDLSRCAGGDKNALRRIFDSEAPRLVAVAQRIVRRRDLAEDVVQDAFVQIWSKAHQYQPGRGSARGWIYAIARNRALNMLRDGKREDLVPEERLEILRDSEQMNEIMGSWQRLDRDGRLHDCLAALEEVRRKGILMAYVGGYSHGEIAGKLDIPLGTAKSWIRRGLTSLRECMA
jgi:RNA polymerase sigma-70 factor (ECF subfamily)